MLGHGSAPGHPLPPPVPPVLRLSGRWHRALQRSQASSPAPAGHVGLGSLCGCRLVGFISEQDLTPVRPCPPRLPCRGGSGAAGLLQTHLGWRLIPDPPGTRWSRAFSQPDFSLHVFPETMFSFVWSWPSKEFQSKTKQNKICFQAFTLLNPRWVSGRLATGSRAALQPPSSPSPAASRSSLGCCRGPWRFAVGPLPPPPPSLLVLPPVLPSWGCFLESARCVRSCLHQSLSPSDLLRARCGVTKGMREAVCSGLRSGWGALKSDPCLGSL